jgi:hypothetical protein
MLLTPFSDFVGIAHLCYILTTLQNTHPSQGTGSLNLIFVCWFAGCRKCCATTYGWQFGLLPTVKVQQMVSLHQQYLMFSTFSSHAYK